MLYKILRSPVIYYDINPAGRIINRFSNDIGIMDTLAAFSLNDAIEGPLIFLIIMLNMFEMTLWFIIPCVIGICGIIYITWYFKEIILASKQYDLR